MVPSVAESPSGVWRSNKVWSFHGVLRILLVSVLVLAFILIEVLFGGAGILFYSLPALLFVGSAGILSLLAIRSKSARTSDACLAVTVLCFSYLAARAALSPVESLARHDIFVILGALGVYLLTSLYLTFPSQRLGLVTVFLILGVIHTGIGVVQFTRADNFMPIPFLPRPDYGARASGFYGCPNHLAGFLEVAALFGLSVVCWSRWAAWKRILVGWATLVCMAGLVLTGSRGGYLSFTAGLAVFVILSLFSLRKVASYRFWTGAAWGLVGLILAMGAMAAIVLRSDVIRQRVEMIADTGNIRLTLWQGAIEQFLLAPVIGTGAGTYLFYGRFFLPPTIVNDPRYVHNDYLHLLAEYGVVGAVIVALCVAIHVWAGIRGTVCIIVQRLVPDRRATSSALALMIGALSSVACYAVHSIVDFNLHITANALLMAFVFGILASPGISAPDMPRASFWSNRLARLALPLVGLVTVTMAIPLVQSEFYSECARAAIDANEYGDAMDFAKQGIRHDPRNPDLFYYLGWSQYKLSQTPGPAVFQRTAAETALSSLNSALALFPQDTRLHIARAYALRRLDRFDEAEAAYRDALRWDPNSATLRARIAASGSEQLEEKAVSRENSPILR